MTARGTAAAPAGIRAASAAAWAAALLVLALLPAALPRNDLMSFGVLVFLYVTLAQSWNLLAGYAGQISLGHAGFFGLGALAARSLWIAGTPPAPALAAGGAAACAFGLLIGVPAFRLRGVYFAIGTLGLAEILRVTVQNVLPDVSTLPAATIARYALVSRYELALALAAASVGAVWLLARARLGVAMLAMRDDEDAAEATGIDTLRVKLAALAVSATFAGLAGGLFALYEISYYPAAAFSPSWTFDAVLITFVGGAGTLGGPIAGALFYLLIREVLARSLVELHLFIFGLLFILVVLLWPGGLVDAAERVRRAVRGMRRA